MPLRISRKLILIFIFTGLAIGGTSYYSYTKVDLASQLGSEVSQTRETLFLIETVLNQTSGTEESAGKAILTGDEKYFNEYKSNRLMLLQEVASLKDFEKDNLTQQQNLQNLESHVNTALSIVDYALQKRTDSTEHTLKYLETGKSKANIDEIKNTLLGMKEYENSLLTVIEEENNKATNKSIQAIILSAGLAVLFIVWLLFLLNTDISRREKVEKIAQENEKKYRDIFEQVGDVVYTSDYKGFFTILNPRIIVLTGYIPEELMGKHFSMLLAPEWVEEVTQYYLTQFKNRTGETLKEFQIITKTGERKWVEQKAGMMRNGARVTGFQCTVRDITGRKNMESALVQTNKKFQNIFTSSPLAIIMAEFESGKILDINNEFTALFGYTKDDVKGMSTISFDLFTREERSKIKEDIKIYGYSKNKEHKFRTKSGAVLTCLYSSIQMDNEGVPSLLISYSNITEIKKLENALAENNKKFLTIFNSSSLAVCISEITDFTKPGQITEVNNSFCNLFSLKEQDVIGKTMPSLGLIDEAEFEIFLTSYAGKKYVPKQELTLSANSGEKLNCLVSYNEVSYGGNSYRVWLFNNITEFKKLENELMTAKEKAEESIRVKESFVANMSHEIRTPITGIMGLTELLGETTLSAEQKEYLGGIMHSSESLLTIINDILDISKINAGKIIIEKLPFSLHTIIKNVAFTLDPRAIQKNILFKCRIDESVPENVIGDSVRLSQILWNLAGNAIKFTEKGFVEISVIKLSEEKNKVRLLFTIIDTGIGIAKNRLTNIFEEFTQADSTISRKYGGTGLGLPIANKLVELHGGTISIESQEGLGSAFRFSLEYGKYSPQFITPENDIEKLQIKSEVDLSGIRVLLAEDNIVNQGVCKKILANKGAKIDVVDNGKKVIEMLRSNLYDIILMDIQMPEMNGYEASRFIRSMKSPTSNIPIIALTALAMEGENEKCFAAGMNGYISKPFKAHELTNKVWQYTRQKKSFATY